MDKKEFIILPKFKRMSDESQESYIWRMCRNKDLYDLKWEEVTEILNTELGYNFGSSKYRKDYQIGMRAIDLHLQENEDNEDLLEQIRVAKLELEMERKKKQTDSVFYNRIIREGARDEMLIEQFSKAIENAKLEVPEFKPIQIKENNSEWILCISDIHSYKEFTSLTNRYNKKIFEQRMDNLLSEVVNKIEKEKITKLKVLNAGDNLEGILRNSALEILELGVVDAIVEYQRWLLEWLNSLSTYVEIEYIHLISSNHTESRPLNSRAGQFPREDFEKLIANYVKDLTVDNERIEVIVPDQLFVEFQIAGYNVIAHHGHGISGTRKYVERMTRKRRIFYDYAMFGHLHKSAIEPMDEGATNDCEIIRIPSIVGTDPYADSILEGSKSSALLLRFDEGKGRTQENKIILN